MIITVTANPMVEHFFHVPGFAAGLEWRPERKAKVVATGKPLNVARALTSLGAKVTAVCAVGGATGREIEELVEREGIDARMVPIREESRRGFTLYDNEGQDTTVYGPRVSLRDAELDAIVSTVRCLLPAELIVLGGSCSRPELYERLAHLGVPIVVDADGEGLELALSGDVFLAKPNMREVAETLGALDGQRALLELTRRRARNAVVTDGGGEAWFRWQGKTFRVMPPKVDVVHTIGCGDALCAGLIHASSRPAQEAVAFAMACGAQSATSDGVADLDETACEALARQIVVVPA